MLKFNKKIISLLLIVVMLLTLSACGKNSTFSNDSGAPQESSTAQNNTENNSSYSPKLYKVTNKSGNNVWLFGSIHVGKSSFFPLPDYVTSALYGSDVVAVEFDLVSFEKDGAAQVQALTKMFSPNQSIKSHLTSSAEQTYNKAVEILTENNFYNQALDFYMPVVWSMLIDNIVCEKSGGDANLGIDRHVINAANEKNIKIEDIESADAQYQMLANFSDELQTEMLANSIDSYDDPNYKKELEKLMNIWEKGDYEGLRQMLKEEDEQMKKEIPAYFDEYNDAMKTKRDALMTQYAVDALSDGKEAFICVGAAHIAGENGMIDSLKAKGYTVEEVK